MASPAQPPAGSPAPLSRRRDPRLAALLVLGGWFLVEAVLLSFSSGIVHPYYLSALAPVVYPPDDRRRQPETRNVPQCPSFGLDSVVERLTRR